MRIKTIMEVIKGWKLMILLHFKKSFMNFYRLSYLAALSDTPAFEALSRDTVPAEHLLRLLSKGSSCLNAGEAWLNLGVRLGLLKKNTRGYSLRGFITKKLAYPENDSLRALVKEAASLHHLYITGTPAMLSSGILWDPRGPHREYGSIIARSSRTLEPLIFEAIDRFFPKAENLRLLEVGCGYAGYICYAAEKHRDLEAVGLELDPDIAGTAKDAIRKQGLQDRVSIQVKDIRNLKTQKRFDVVTLYNNIYYFPVEDRVKLFSSIRSFLKPGGRLLITTGCMNGGIEFELVNVIHTSTRGWGRLPYKDELTGQLSAAGFNNIVARDLLPGSKYYVFSGNSPG